MNREIAPFSTRTHEGGSNAVLASCKRSRVYATMRVGRSGGSAKSCVSRTTAPSATRVVAAVGYGHVQPSCQRTLTADLRFLASMFTSIPPPPTPLPRRAMMLCASIALLAAAVAAAGDGATIAGRVAMPTPPPQPGGSTGGEVPLPSLAAGLRVVLDGGARSTLTAADGAWAFGNVSAGVHMVEVQHREAAFGLVSWGGGVCHPWRGGVGSGAGRRHECGCRVGGGGGVTPAGLRWWWREWQGLVAVTCGGVELGRERVMVVARGSDPGCQRPRWACGTEGPSGDGRLS
jgi:hypothetical protein